jgi:hypothetical protein
MVDIVGTLLTTPRRPLATSALPDAPVVDDDHRWAYWTRQAFAAAMQVIARRSAPFRPVSGRR